MIWITLAMLAATPPTYELGTPAYVLAAPSYAIVPAPPVVYATRFDRLLGRSLLPLFPRLRPFKRTVLGQKIHTVSGAATREWYHITSRDSTGVTNPNAVFPIAVPGGLHFARGWTAESAVYLPRKVRVYEQSMSAGLYRPVNRVRWTYPVGTVFVETLLHKDKPFEVRSMEKLSDGKWRFEIAHQDASNFPLGYRPMRAGSACVECHRDAGASKQYGLLWRGDDFVFSHNPAQEHRDDAAEAKATARKVVVTSFASPAACSS